MSKDAKEPCEFEWLKNASGDCTPLTDWASFVSSIFVLTTMAISFIHIRNHLKFSRQRMLTKYTIRILLMPPIYGYECWLALRFPTHAIPYRILREGYEFLLAYLGGAVPLARRLHVKRRTGRCKDQHHVFPFNFLEPWRSGAQFVRLTLVGTLQYVPASILVMLISLSAWQLNWYHDGAWRFNDAYMYCALITNFSQVWAMYCLVLFYHALHDELKPIRPFGKFLSVKLVVFFTYWQSLGIGIMQTMEGRGGVLDEMQDAIKGEADTFDDEFDPPGFAQHQTQAEPTASTSSSSSMSGGSSEEFATSLQNFIICVEMFFFAVGHIFAFPAEEFAGRIYHDSIDGQGRPRGNSSELSDEFESEDEEAVLRSALVVDRSDKLIGGGGGGGGLVRSLSNPDTSLIELDVLSTRNATDQTQCAAEELMQDDDDALEIGGDREKFKKRQEWKRVHTLKTQVIEKVGKGVNQVRESGNLVGDSLTALPRGVAATIYDSSMNVARSSANLPASIASAARDGGSKIDKAKGAAEVVAAVGGASVNVAKSIGSGVADLAKNVGQLPVRTVGSAVGGTVNVGRVAATQVLRRLPMLPPLHKEKFRDGINFTDILNAIRTVTYLEVEEERSHLLDFFEEQESAWNDTMEVGDYSSDEAALFDSHTRPRTTTIPKKHVVHGSTKSA